MSCLQSMHRRKCNQGEDAAPEFSGPGSGSPPSQAVGSTSVCESTFPCAFPPSTPGSRTAIPGASSQGEELPGLVAAQSGLRLPGVLQNKPCPEGFLLPSVPGQTSKNRLQHLSVEKRIYQQQKEHPDKSHQCHIFISDSPYQGSHISK